MRPIAAIPMLAVALLAGCEVTHRVAGAISPDTMSLADRCGEVMRLAMPFAEIELDKRTSDGTGVDTIVAQVTGLRGDLPKDGSQSRAVAAECQFDNQTLTSFRWTQGGPTSPGAQPPAKP